MQAVFRLVKHNRLRPVNDRIGHFFVPVGRQAMHEDRIILGLGHGFFIDLIRRKRLHAGIVIFIAHRYPAISHHHIGPCQRTVHIGQTHLAAFGIGCFDQALIGAITHRAGQIHRKAEFRCRMNEGCRNIIAITNPGKFKPFERAFMFLDGHQIGHDLARMALIGQAVNHRHGGVFRHFVQLGFISGPDHDRIDKARQNARRIGNAFAPAKLAVAGIKDYNITAKLAHADFK